MSRKATGSALASMEQQAKETADALQRLKKQKLETGVPAMELTNGRPTCSATAAATETAFPAATTHDGSMTFDTSATTNLFEEAHEVMEKVPISGHSLATADASKTMHMPITHRASVKVDGVKIEGKIVPNLLMSLLSGYIIVKHKDFAVLLGGDGPFMLHKPTSMVFELIDHGHGWKVQFDAGKRLRALLTAGQKPIPSGTNPFDRFQGLQAMSHTSKLTPPGREWRRNTSAKQLNQLWLLLM
jgi:hypothetical protein